jgi:hypothetical protein
MPRKNYSLNESQDRAIKKKGFKSVAIAGAKPVANRELGFFALLDTATVNSELTNSTGMIEKLLDKPEVNGISVIIPWRDLAPEEEKYDWSKIEKLLAICKQKKPIRVSPVCDNSAERPPSWIYKRVKSITFKGSGKDHKMPILGFNLRCWATSLPILVLSSIKMKRYTASASLAVALWEAPLWCQK